MMVHRGKLPSELARNVYDAGAGSTAPRTGEEGAAGAGSTALRTHGDNAPTVKEEYVEEYTYTCSPSALSQDGRDEAGHDGYAAAGVGDLGGSGCGKEQKRDDREGRRRVGDVCGEE